MAKTKIRFTIGVVNNKASIISSFRFQHSRSSNGDILIITLPQYSPCQISLDRSNIELVPTEMRKILQRSATTYQYLCSRFRVKFKDNTYNLQNRVYV